MQRPLLAEAASAARDAKAEGAAAVNEGILVWVGGGLVPRDMAKVYVGYVAQFGVVRARG